MQSRGHKADFAHFLIESGEQLLSLLWPAADARRAASLEIIARTAYTAEESACHYLETIGLDQSGAIRNTLELARRQDSNEQTHEDIFPVILAYYLYGSVSYTHLTLPTMRTV